MSEEQKDIQVTQDNSNNTSSYRSIFKATSLFGGVQVFKILINVVKQKVIAILLGTTGMGVLGLYESALAFIQGLTSMGLSTSAVKNVAEANSHGDEQEIGRTVTALRRLVWATGLFGTVIFLVLSPMLSKMSFGNYDYAIPFAILSVILLLRQLSDGQLVVLQGLRKLKDLAKANVLGALFGLVVSIPLYYFLKINGIIPSLIIYALVTLLLTWWFTRKIEIVKDKQTPKETLRIGKDMLVMGIVMSLNSVLVYGVSYAIRAFISYQSGPDQVGLFSAGFSMVNAYVGMVFTAMTTDYYPRLATVNKDNEKCRVVVNQQIEIALLILIPLVVLFIIAAPLMVMILFSDEFLPIVWYMRIAMLGIILKAVSWAISYQFIAKQEMQTFITNEAIGNLLTLVTSVVAYYYYGLNGLGIAYVVTLFLYTVLVFSVSRKKHGFSFSRELIKLLIYSLILAVVAFVTFVFIKTWVVYVISSIIMVICLYMSYKGLNERIGLVNLLKRRK